MRFEKVPLGHCRQVVELGTATYLPSGQGLHPPSALRKKPDAQAPDALKLASTQVLAELDPKFTVVRPCAHAEHAVLPENSWYVPKAHRGQERLPSSF